MEQSEQSAGETDEASSPAGEEGSSQGPATRETAGVSQPCDHLHEWDAEAVVPEVLSFFGKKHTLAIMYEFAFAEEPLRFNELEERLDISSTTLSERLKELVARDYVTRESYDEIPPRVEYEATEKTRALTPIFEDFYDWAGRYAVDEEGVFEKQ